MCIPSSPYQPPPRSSFLNIAPTPPTLQPLTFTSEPVIDLDDLMSLAAMPAVTIIPPELAGPSQHSPQQRIQHAQSDCGHYGSPPQLNRSHSLLRNFSLRSRNGFSLRTRQNQVHCPPLSLSAPVPGNVTTDSTSASTASGSSLSLLSVWKKWRMKSVTNLSTLDGQDGELDAIPAHLSCPQGPARKRSLLLPVSRLIAPFRIPSTSPPPSDDEPCVIIPQYPSIPLVQQESVLDAIQDEDDNKVNGDSNPIFWDADGVVESIRQIDGRVPDVGMESQTHNKAGPELKSTLPDIAPPLPSRSSPPLTPSSLPLLTPSSLNSPPSSSPPLQTPSSSLNSLPPSSPSPDVNLGLPSSSIPESNSQSSSNPNLKLSLSQKRRAKFTLGDGSDLDCDSLAVSVSAVVRAPSLNVGTGTEPVVLPNDSTQPTAMHRPTLARHDGFVHESRDQVGTTSTSSEGTATATTTNGKPTRRWTLSSALTDESISDEGLVKELEKMREVLEWDCAPIDKDGHDFLSSSPPPSPSNPSNPWLITQRALLTTRELILTERHYLSSLLLLLCPDSTLTPVPEMMVSQAKELVDVSKRLLKGMEEEPSVRGVAEVFIEVGGGGLDVDGAESAFVGWCGVVGRWFQDDLADTQAVVDVKRKKKGCENGVGSGGGSGDYHLMISEHEGSGPDCVTFPISTTTGEHSHTSPLMRTVSTWRKSMPSVSEGSVWRRDRDKDEGGSSTCGRGRIAFDEVRSSSSMSMTLTSIGKPIRKPAVRDLAILPTQRVTRYVLLYRDLLANTPPSSSSYPIVERAVEAACRIAEKCNQAQGNAAFVADGSTRDSSSSSGSSTSMLNNSNNSSSSSSRRRLFSGKRVMTAPEPNNNLKLNKSGQGSTIMQSSSPTSSPTKSHFFLLSSSPVSTLPSTSSLLPPTSSSSLSRPSSPTKNRFLAINPPPPSSFNSKIPIARSRQSSTFTGSSSTTTITTSGTFSSPSSSSSSSSFPSLSTSLPLFLPKSTSSSSNFSSQVTKPLSLMSPANGLGGRSVSGPAVDGHGTGGAEDSVTAAQMKRYAGAMPTKIRV